MGGGYGCGCGGRGFLIELYLHGREKKGKGAREVD